MRTTKKMFAALIGLTTAMSLTACVSVDTSTDRDVVPQVHPVTDPSIGIAFDGNGRAVKPSQDAQVVIEVFSDFLCPFCKQFEQEHAEDLLELAGDDRFDVRWRPVAWLDRHSGGTEFSTRTAALLVHVAQESPQHFWDVVEAIMNVQEDGPDMTIQDLADVASSVGVETDTAAAIEDPALRSQVLDFSNTASALEVRHVPWVVIDGEQWDLSADDAGTLIDRAHAALG